MMEKLAKLRESGDQWLEDEGNRDLVLCVVKNVDDSTLNDLYKVTPFILRLLDHYCPSSKAIGLQCVATLVEKFSINDLKSVNFDGLFYETLKSLLYRDDPEIHHHLVPTLIRFIHRFEYDWVEFEKILLRLVNNCNLTSDVDLKKLYCQRILEIMKIIECRCKKFTKTLLSLVTECVQVENCEKSYEMMCVACEILKLLLKYNSDLSWRFFYQVMVPLIKLRINLAENDSKGKHRDILASALAEVMKILTVENVPLYEEMRSCIVNDPLYIDDKILTNIFDETNPFV